MTELKPSDFEMFAKENDQLIQELGIECEKTKMGSHKCSVETRYGWCCDLCLENELMWLYSHGVHTINSCCGHGNAELASILVVGPESIEKMDAMGYVPTEEQVNYANMKAYAPKTPLPYMKQED